jgi:hypothetical protein
MSLPSQLSLSSSQEGAKRVLEVLSGCENFQDVERLGFLFHGTIEALAGPLYGGGYDGVFWTAEAPAIAQSYIPRAGASMIVGRPDIWEMDDALRPSLDDGPIMDWALARANATKEDLDIGADGYRVTSWRNLPGWPKQKDLVAWIESELGYEPKSYGTWEILCDRVDGREVFRPASWSREGTLIIALAPDLKVDEPQWSEDALGYKNHNRVGDFARFAEEGRDAFSMHDQLQSEYWGNVGHRAIGILPAGLSKLDWIAIPACRHDGPDVDWSTARETVEFEALMAEIAPGYAKPADNVAGMCL